MTSIKLEIVHFDNFSLEDLFNMLPARITLKKGEPFNSFRLRIEKVLLYNEIEDQIVPSFLANYICDSTECTGENAWLVRQLIQHNVYDKCIRKTIIKLIIALFENNYIENIWSKK